MMFEIGRVCVKLAGRDAGKYCVIVEKIDDTYVLIEGDTRRKKCNVSHLEPLEMTVDISSGADRETVAKALEEKEIFVSKPKKSKSAKPKQQSKRVQKLTKK
ncbi:MAG: 50S ribosomal protein L14e [Candidatus Nanoarchaeia archaeon]